MLLFSSDPSAVVCLRHRVEELRIGVASSAAAEVREAHQATAAAAASRGWQREMDAKPPGVAACGGGGCALPPALLGIEKKHYPAAGDERMIRIEEALRSQVGRLRSP